MASKFPNVPRPELEVPPEGAVAYAYVAAAAKYDYPFFENDETFLFTDSAGKQTAVGSSEFARKTTTPITACGSKSRSFTVRARRSGARRRSPNSFWTRAKRHNPIR